MDKIINKIIELNSSIFGEIKSVQKINVGFTNTIYNINDKFIIKLCTKENNEPKFKKEIEFYNANKDNELIPKLYYANTDKIDIPYYEIIEKIEGESLYNVWHKLTETEREEIIRQLCTAMEQIHSNKCDKYDWARLLKDKFIVPYKEAVEKNIFTIEEQELIEKAYSKFDEYLESDDFVLVHNDLHFDNVFYNDGKIKIIDFERSMYAPRDFELDILYRMIRMPWKYATEEIEPYTKESDYENIMTYINKYYPKLLEVHDLYKRQGTYDMVYFIKNVIDYPELKEDILNGAKLVCKDDLVIKR